MRPEVNATYFDLPEKVDNSLKHQIKFIIIHNELLDKNELKKEISRLLSKCKHGYNMHEHRKIVKQMNHTKLFVTCHKYYIKAAEINILLSKTYLFITLGKI